MNPLPADVNKPETWADAARRDWNRRAVAELAEALIGLAALIWIGSMV